MHYLSFIVNRELLLKLYMILRNNSIIRVRLKFCLFSKQLFLLLMVSSVTGVVGVLNYNQTELFVGRNHDLMFLRSDSNECNNLFFVNFLDLRLCLV